MGKKKGKKNKQQEEKKTRGKGPRLCEWCEILAGGKEAVDAFVNSASDVNARNEQGDTILHVAVFRMHDTLQDGSEAECNQAAEMVSYLANHCDINSINNDGLYPADVLSSVLDNPAILDSRAETVLEALVSRNTVEGYSSVSKETYRSRSIFMASFPKCHYKHVITDQDNVKRSNRLPQLIKTRKWSLVRKAVENGCARNIEVDGECIFNYAMEQWDSCLNGTYAFNFFPLDILQKLLHPVDLMAIRGKYSTSDIHDTAQMFLLCGKFEVVAGLTLIFAQDLEYTIHNQVRPLYWRYTEMIKGDWNPSFLEVLPRECDPKIVLMELLCFWLECSSHNQEYVKRILHQLCSQITVGGWPDLCLVGCKKYEVCLRNDSLNQPSTVTSFTFSRRTLSIDHLRILFEILNKHSVFSCRSASICIKGNNAEFDMQEHVEVSKMLEEFEKGKVVPSLKTLCIAAVGKRFSTSREVVKHIQPQDCPQTLIKEVEHYADYGYPNLAQHIISKLF